MLTEQNRIQFNELEYYYNMIEIANFFILNKHYSFLKDIYFDFLLDKNIDDIAIPNTIFVNPENAKCFSKKQIINFIRNALNHNNHKKLYELIKENNILYIEINLRKTKPIPFHIKMTLADYSKIMCELIKANKLDLTEFSVKQQIDIKSKKLYEELDNIIYKQYILKSKLEDSTMEDIKKLLKENKRKEIKDILTKEKIIVTENQLTTLQKNCVIEDLENWKNIIYINKETILRYSLHKIIPSGKCKLEQISYILLINDLYLKEYTNTYNNVIYDMLFINKEKNHFFYEFFKDSEYNNILVRDFDNVMHTAITILMSYIFADLIIDETTKIGDDIYETERLRNSFVHGKWFIGQKGSYKLFDNPPNDYDDYHYTWRASIPFKNMITFMENFYKKFYKENIKKEENNNFLEIPLFLTYSKEESMLPSHLTFLKKETKFVFNLYVNDYNRGDYFPWNLYKVVNDELVEVQEKKEQEYFFEELEKTNLFTNEIKIIIKTQYQQYLKFKNNLITLEELQENDEAFKNIFVNNNEIKVLKKENI